MQPLEATEVQPEEPAKPKDDRPEWQKVKLKKVEVQEDEDAITSLIMTRPERIPTTELPDFNKKPGRPDVGQTEQMPTEEILEEEEPKKKTKKPKRPRKRTTEDEHPEAPTEAVDTEEPTRHEMPSDETPEERPTHLEHTPQEPTSDEVCRERWVPMCKRLILNNFNVNMTRSHRHYDADNMTTTFASNSSVQ